MALGTWASSSVLPARRFETRREHMARDVIVAADIGTTEVKVTLLTADGEVVARGSGSYTTGSMISGSHVEQHPEEWWEATVAAVRSVLEDRHRPIALALTGQM